MSLPDFNATIYFYSARESPYGCFSNFSRHGFELDGYWWMTNEHYFQAQKFAITDSIWFEKIRGAKTPKEAAKMGRSRQHPLRSDWEDVKDEIMQRGVLCKFSTHPKIRDILLKYGAGKPRSFKAGMRLAAKLPLVINFD